MTFKILMESLGNTTEVAKRNAMSCIVMLIKGNEAVLELLMDSNTQYQRFKVWQVLSGALHLRCMHVKLYLKVV